MKTNDSRADAAYIRYSSHRQDGNTTVEVQLEAIRRAVGGPCVEYVDKARTGRAIAGREALLRLLDDCAAGRIRHVYVYNWSRLGRSSETHAIAADLEELGVGLTSISEGDDPLARGIGLVVAQDFSRKLSQNVGRALERRFGERSWTGGRPPFGFRVVTAADGKRRLAIDDDEARVVRDVFGWYLNESIGVKAIAARLRAQGTPTRLGAEWSFTTVRGILTNSALTGLIQFKRRAYKLNRQTGKRLYKWLDADSRLSYADEALRIIGDNEFRRAQAKIAERARSKSITSARRLLRPFTGLLYCGACNSVYYAQKSNNGRGSYHYYGCSCRARRGSKACSNAVSIREDQLAAAVKGMFGVILEASESTIQAIVKESEKSQAAHRDHAEQLRRDIAAQEKIIAGLQRLMIDPDLIANLPAKMSVIRQCGEAEAKRNQLRDALLQTGDDLADDASARLREARALFEQARKCFTSISTPAEFHRFVEDFVGPMAIQPDGRIVALHKPEKQTAAGDSAAVPIGIIAATGLEPVTRGL